MPSKRLSLPCLLILPLLALSGCLTLKTLTSGKVGCPPDDIEITNEQMVFPIGKTWTSTCKSNGAQYACNSLDRDAKGNSRISCELIQGTVAVSTPGCASDAECKGDRICEQRQCVSPSNTATPAPGPDTETARDGQL